MLTHAPPGCSLDCQPFDFCIVPPAAASGAPSVREESGGTARVRQTSLRSEPIDNAAFYDISGTITVAEMERDRVRTCLASARTVCMGSARGC
jgi:hypothetical protein